MEERDLFGLSADDRSAAYTATKERFDLKASQRDRLDESLSYSLLMFYAHNESWGHVEMLLQQEGIAG